MSEALAWAAGIVDGEGCISIIRHPPTPGSRCKTHRHVLHLKVTMGDRSTVERLATIFGHGTVQVHVARSSRVNASFSWVAQSRKAASALGMMRPYLWTKRAEADVALEYMALPLARRGGPGGSPKMNAPIFQARDRLYWRLRKLKPRWRFYQAKEARNA